MYDYQRDHLARWQANTEEDWKAVLKQQGYSEEKIQLIASRAEFHRNKGLNQLQAREQALIDYSWQSSGQF